MNFFFFNRECRATEPDSRAKNMDNAAKLWMESLKLVGLPIEENLDVLLNKIKNEILPSL